MDLLKFSQLGFQNVVIFRKPTAEMCHLLAVSENSNWRRGGSVVSASDLGSEGREFEPWLVHPRCVLRQNT